MPPSDTVRQRLDIGGMTCAACSARVQRALERTDGVDQAAVNLMTNSAAITYDPARTSPQQLIAVVEKTGYEARVPADEFAAAPSATEDVHAHHHAEASLARKAVFSLVVFTVSMLLSMVVAEAPHGGRHVADDILMRLMHPLTAVVLSVPGVAAVSAGAWRVVLLLPDHPRGALGRPALLRARLVGTPPRRGRHERAHRARHRRRVRLQRGHDALPGLVHRARTRAGRLLRGGQRHHRVHPGGQLPRGARQGPRVGRAQAADAAAPRRRCACCVARRRWTSRWSSCGRATSSACARASRSPPTAWWWRAGARWTSRCSPASRCRWRAAPASGWWAAR